MCELLGKWEIVVGNFLIFDFRILDFGKSKSGFCFGAGCSGTKRPDRRDADIATAQCDDTYTSPLYHFITLPC